MFHKGVRSSDSALLYKQIDKKKENVRYGIVWQIKQQLG